MSDEAMLQRLGEQPPGLVAGVTIAVAYYLTDRHNWPDYRFTVTFGSEGRVLGCSPPKFGSGKRWWEP